jgi:Tfp pilus assembly protein PilE
MKSIKLKGSTLLEGIVAITVLMVSFSICAVVFANLLKTGNNHSETSALLEMKKILNECTEKDRFIDESFDYTNFKIFKKVTKKENSENLLNIKLKAVDANGKEIGQLKKIIINEEK